MDFEQIPGPRGLPFLGNLLDLKDDEAPLRALERLADIYGPIYQLTLAGGKRQLVVSSANLMKEVMDEKRFMKTAIQGLSSNANGLIVAGTLEHDWEQGHRILRPAFGPLKIEEMFDSMKDIAHQLILKWARFGSEVEIAITEDFSNLTLDTIALCTMDYRFNSFYRGGMHPYVAAMSNMLGAAGASQSRIPVVSAAMSMIGLGGDGVDREQLTKDSDFMRKTAQEIIDARRSSPTKKDDFLNTLLFGKDPKTGEPMRDGLIAAQMQTFLVAGHETTSGLLSFAVIFILQNPETYRKAQQEVDHVVGSSTVTLQHIRDLKYIYAVLRETLRLVPTAPSISKIPHPHSRDEIIILGGKYKIERTDRIRILLGKSMQDYTVFGEDAREFKPERMLESNQESEVQESFWRPFSEGSRACVGRTFSLQEAILALTLILQNFDLRLTDPMYKIRIKQNITVKPLGLYIKASLRNGMSPFELERRLQYGAANEPKIGTKNPGQDSSDSYQGGTPLTILFGSNTGTCQSLAQRLSSEVSAYGFVATVQDADAAVEDIPRNHPTIILTSSYEGEPPDNALQFVQYLQSLEANELQGCRYAVFGCGHKDWHATFHRIPNLVDDNFRSRGGERIVEMGLSDVSQGNPMADFERWLDKMLLPELKKLSPSSTDSASDISLPEIEADISTADRVETLQQELRVGTVTDVQQLTSPSVQPEKRHMEIELPPESTYECGDYLAILPQSPEANVRAIMAHFKLPKDATITFRSKTFAPLPLNTPLSVADLLRNYYELAKPTTRRGLAVARKHAKDEDIQKELSSFLDDEQQFQKEITEAKMSLFELLKIFPAIDMPFPAFLSLLPQLSVRQYSISSSPLRNPKTCTITYSVVADETEVENPFYGVATTFLSSLKRGDRVQVGIRRTAKQTFRLPLDVENTPLLMFAAGSGLAPFRGFIEQRAIQLEANPILKLAPAHLFLGCRSDTRDRIYPEEMDGWVKKGAVNIHYAFSQEPEKSFGCKHVADRMLKESETIISAWVAGARAYTCGNRAFAISVGQAARKIVDQRMETRKAEGLSDQEIEKRKATIYGSFSERAADDVFD